MNVKELKEKLHNISDDLVIVMPDYMPITFIQEDKKYGNGVLIFSDGEVCCKCDSPVFTKTDTYYFDEENQEYYCEECFYSRMDDNLKFSKDK